MQRSCVTAIPPSLVRFRPICRQQGLYRGSLLLQAPCSPKANFGVSHSPSLKHSKRDEEWVVYRRIQSWWSSLLGNSKKPLPVVKKKKVVPKKNHALKLASATAAVKDDGHKRSQEASMARTPKSPQHQSPVLVKKKKKNEKAVLEHAWDGHHESSFQRPDTDDYFSVRFHQALCYFYAGVISGAMPASTSVKQFLATTHFNTSFQLLSSAVLPETKQMLSEGHIVGIPTSYPKLYANCWVNKQGCYINKITTPQKSFGLYVGGSASLAPKPCPITRPLRGKISTIPYAVKRPGIPAGVGRRVAQHLHDSTREKHRASAHYRFMEAVGNRYDFRLLAAFEEEVATGAVWLLEAFFVLELGTIRPETDGARYVGLNRVSPLITNCPPPARFQQVAC